MNLRKTGKILKEERKTHIYNLYICVFFSLIDVFKKEKIYGIHLAMYGNVIIQML